MDSYIVEICFCTDDDFYFDYSKMNCGMTETDYAQYELNAQIPSREELLSWGRTTVSQLREHLHANRMKDVVNGWLDQLEKAIEANQDLDLHIYGNHEGTYIKLINTHGVLFLNIPVDAALYSKVRDSGVNDYKLSMIISEALDSI